MNVEIVQIIHLTVEMGRVFALYEFKQYISMKLFYRKDYRLQVEPIVFSIKAFKRLDQRDRTVGKTQLEKELAFIYFVYDPRSDLQFIVDEQERIERVKELIGFDSKFKIDSDLQKAIDVYISMTETSSSLLLKDIKVGVDKLRDYLRSAEVDSESFDKYTRALKELIPLSQKIVEAERTVVKEIEDLSEMRGNRQQSLLDGGFDNLLK